MHLLSLTPRLIPVLALACVLSACGGGNNGGGVPIVGTPTPPATQPDTSVKPEMRCAP
ncbi:hypothetical protein [Variovorax gossypii]